ADLGEFSSGARLSALGKVATPTPFVGFPAGALQPFFACETSATRYRKGDRAFERCPPVDHLNRPKVLFQTVRCISLPQRLVAPAAEGHHLACSTTAMITPPCKHHVSFISAIINSTLANAWYKTNDFNRAIKISILKTLPI